jgi:uncharacterized protein (DUF302 family)
MSYYFSKILSASFEEAVGRTVESLKKEGFGVLTDIDVQATLKNRLNIDFPPYRILGACHPPYAYEALKKETKIGTMLPCNVIVREAGGGEVEVAAIDPVASMQAVDNPSLKGVALTVRQKLKNVVESL